MTKKLNVAILTGGVSSERKVSISSGKNVFRELLDSEKYNPIFVEITARGYWIGRNKYFKGKKKVTLEPNNFLVGKKK